MKSSDIAALYDRVPLGTLVQITPEHLPKVAKAPPSQPTNTFVAASAKPQNQDHAISTAASDTTLSVEQMRMGGALASRACRSISFLITMANTKSAAKRARQTVKRSLRNRSVVTGLRTMQKTVRSAQTQSPEQVRALISAIDKAAKRGIIHENAANRRKARLNKALAGAK
jgi:small subunit ribosomal protein S20